MNLLEKKTWVGWKTNTIHWCNELKEEEINDACVFFYQRFLTPKRRSFFVSGISKNRQNFIIIPNK